MDVLTLNVPTKRASDLRTRRPVNLSRFLVEALGKVRVDPSVDVPTPRGFRSHEPRVRLGRAAACNAKEVAVGVAILLPYRPPRFPLRRRSPCVCRGLSDGASRTRTGDLLGAIQLRPLFLLRLPSRKYLIAGVCIDPSSGFAALRAASVSDSCHWRSSPTSEEVAQATGV
jgi:hypothetical protein